MLMGMPAVVRIESHHDLPFSRQEIWPSLSQTDWVNRSLGLPPVTYDLKPLREGGSEVTACAKFFGFTLRWKELPFEWLEGEFYRVRRVFETGPLAEANLGIDFQDGNAGGTHLRAYSHLTPRSAIGGWLARQLFGPKATRDM